MASVGALTSLEGYSGVCSMTELDAPKAGRSGDRFDRTAFAQGLANLLYDAGKQKATGLVVGLTGPWGSGKSQTLLYVKEFLDEQVVQKPLLVMQYNPWLFSGRENMIAMFLQALSALMDDKKYTERFPEQLKELKSDFDRFKESFGDVIRKIASVDSRTKAAAEILLDSGSLEKQKKAWAQKLDDKVVSVIVIIDELDRLTDDEIRGMVQVVKSVADFPTISYLLAYDPDRVARALGGIDLKFGHNYLEKIVQVQTRLPRISEAKMKAFIKSELPSALTSDTAVEEIVETLVPEIIYTPRDARRFVAAFDARKVVLDEVDRGDLLEYCALESRIPVISERLQNLATRVSVDGCRELNRRWDELPSVQECVERILDVFKDDAALRRLLLRLLPALDEAGAEETVRDDRRLCYETSL
jgi:predicted KAP-like P-loop ATPase